MKGKFYILRRRQEMWMRCFEDNRIIQLTRMNVFLGNALYALLIELKNSRGTGQCWNRCVPGGTSGYYFDRIEEIWEGNDRNMIDPSSEIGQLIKKGFDKWIAGRHICDYCEYCPYPCVLGDKSTGTVIRDWSFLVDWKKEHNLK